MTLEQYFHLIINKPPVKEPEMNFLKLSMFFTEQLEKLSKLWTKPTTFVDNSELHTFAEDYEDGYWAFEMYTPEWYSDDRDEVVAPIHTMFITPHEGTWMEVLDKILDAMEKHYGYNIKEQVYYSVNFPLNEPSPYTGEVMAGHGRCLNDERLQQILLAFPELYLSSPWSNQPTEAMFQ